MIRNALKIQAKWLIFSFFGCAHGLTNSHLNFNLHVNLLGYVVPNYRFPGLDYPPYF